MKLKQQPEDFIVDELFSFTPSNGPFTWFQLTKRGLGTLDALKLLTVAWNVPLKRFGFAGLKDKHALTTQVCSARGVPLSRIDDTRIANLEVKALGNAPEPVHLGHHQGNRFKIVARDIDSLPVPRTTFINYFGEQRFSTHNAAIGKAIVKGDYRKAVENILENDGDPLLRVHLDHSPNDFLGALRLLSSKLLRLYVNAYQSRLWNDVVREHVAQGDYPSELPVVGFGTETTDELTRAAMRKEGLTVRDFIFKAIPNLSQEGVMRKVVLDVPDFAMGRLDNDELNPGRKKVAVTFSLPPGSYATEVVRQLFSQESE
ncbi:tRNA pseudouridine(13) synthase TruD [Candidatus Woesearchaeota archaeon]|nr:tRNA pseudouridine(13) synthase TruD [Candidatus Woesearchaeota archaeon]